MVTLTGVPEIGNTGFNARGLRVPRHPCRRAADPRTESALELALRGDAGKDAAALEPAGAGRAGHARIDPEAARRRDAEGVPVHDRLGIARGSRGKGPRVGGAGRAGLRREGLHDGSLRLARDGFRAGAARGGAGLRHQVQHLAPAGARRLPGAGAAGEEHRRRRAEAQARRRDAGTARPIPAALHYAAETIRGLLGKVPIMGICLGHQLLGIALGGKTRRLKFGHHGATTR